MKLDTLNDHERDGYYVGANGECFHPSLDWRDIPPVLPNNGKSAWRSAIMVNGIMTDVALQASDLQRLANTGCKVVGVHNATKGMALDLAQCAGDKLGLQMANNGATETMTKVIRTGFSGDEERAALGGHRQGAQDAGNVQSGGGRDASLKKLDVLTMGGASWSFPEGPRYRHFVNVFDAVPMGAGVGALSYFSSGEVSRFGEVNKPTNLPSLEEDVSNYLARVVDRTVHGPQDVYIPNLPPLEKKP